MSAYQWFTDLLAVVGSQRLNKQSRSWQCPGHQDRNPSLSVREGPEGSVRITCHAGCSREQVLAALRCNRGRLRVPPPVPAEKYAAMVGLKIDFPKIEIHRGTGSPESRGFRLEARHDFGPAVLFRWRNRAGIKELCWESKTPNGGLVPGLFGGVTIDSLPLYKETEVRQAIALDEPVLLVESESSVDALRGWYSTTWAGGARAVNIDRLGQVLGDYPRTVAIPDSDGAGRWWYERVRAAGLAPVVLWPSDGEDARDLYRRLGPANFGRAVTASLNSGQHSNRRAA